MTTIPLSTKAIQGPTNGPTPQDLAKGARQQRRAEQLQNASVYIAIACKSEQDDGRNYRHSRPTMENVDQEILGIFFSKKKANECAREYLEMDDDDDDEEGAEDISVDSDDESTFAYDGSEEDDYDEMQMFQKVWVERRAIEDASRQVHK